MRTALLLTKLFSMLEAQDLIQDTLLISFTPLPDSIIGEITIDSILDTRAAPGIVLGIFEINKYLVIPVDLMIVSGRPLSESIRKIFTAAITGRTPGLQIFIDRFSLHKNSNSLWYPHYKLTSAIRLFRLDDNHQPEYIGQFLYECTQRQKLFGDKLKQGFEGVIRTWEEDFARDLKAIAEIRNPGTKPQFIRFRPERPELKWTNFFGGLDYIRGPHESLWDGELYFSDHETRQRFYRNGYGLRYRSAEQFESIEYAISIDYMMFRLNPDFIFTIKSQFLFGVNRWKDYNTAEHKIYDAFIGDFSLGQTFLFNPLDKTSLLAGLGLCEDVYYIYSRGIQFQAGLLFHLGFKL